MCKKANSSSKCGQRSAIKCILQLFDGILMSFRLDCLNYIEKRTCFVARASQAFLN